MNCPNPKCNTTGIPDDAKFCPNCGALLVESNNGRTQSKKLDDEKLKNLDDNELLKIAKEEYKDDLHYKKDLYNFNYYLWIVVPFTIIGFITLLIVSNGSKVGEGPIFQYLIFIVISIVVVPLVIWKRINNKLLTRFKMKHNISK